MASLPLERRRVGTRGTCGVGTRDAVGGRGASRTSLLFQRPRASAPHVHHPRLCLCVCTEPRLSATHHGAFDLAYLRPIPNLTICSPFDEHELRRLMYTAQLPDKGVFVIRYPRGCGSLADWRCDFEEIAVGSGRCLHEGDDVAILSIGPIGTLVSEVIERSERSIAHYDMRFLKPLDECILEEVGRRFERVITIEDGVRNGGLGSAVTEWMNDHGYSPRIVRMGLPDAFVEHGTVKELYRVVGIDVEGMLSVVEDFFN